MKCARCTRPVRLTAQLGSEYQRTYIPYSVCHPRPPHLRSVTVVPLCAAHPHLAASEGCRQSRGSKTDAEPAAGNRAAFPPDRRVLIHSKARSSGADDRACTHLVPDDCRWLGTRRSGTPARCNLLPLMCVFLTSALAQHPSPACLLFLSLLTVTGLGGFQRGDRVVDRRCTSRQERGAFLESARNDSLAGSQLGSR